MPIGQYRKRPVVIEAIQWTGDDTIMEIINWVLTSGTQSARWHGPSQMGPECRQETCFSAQGQHIVIDTLEGPMRADVGDWIIQGIQGEHYPCKPAIFAATYTPVEG